MSPGNASFGRQDHRQTPSSSVARRVVGGVVSVTGVLVAAVALEAHDFWIVPDPFAVAGDATITVNGQSGTQFPLSQSAGTPASIADARIIGAAGEVRITDIAQEGKVLRFRQKPSAPGQYLVAVSLNPSTRRTTGADLRRYLAAEGAADEAERLAKEAAFFDADSLSYRSSKFASTIVEVGTGPRVFARGTGQPLQFIATSDPARLTVGDTAHFRVLVGGAPAANLRVHAGAAADSALRGRRAPGGGDPDLHLMTDAQGVVHVPLTHPGLWNLRTAHVAPPGPSAPGVWDVHWATFVFVAKAK